MRFFQPLGFFALIGIPIIVLMYLMRQKYKEHQVSSLFLWKKAESYSMAQKPFQKLKKNLLMFLQIIAVALLAIALASPYIMGVSETSHIVFGVDCSLSMQAKDEQEGKSRLEQAKQQIKNKIEQSPPNGIFSIVILQDTPTILSNNSTDKTTLLKQIEAIQPTNGGVDWQNSRELLQLAGAENGQISIFTDQYQPTLEDLDI